MAANGKGDQATVARDNHHTDPFAGITLVSAGYTHLTASHHYLARDSGLIRDLVLVPPTADGHATIDATDLSRPAPASSSDRTPISTRISLDFPTDTINAYLELITLSTSRQPRPTRRPTQAFKLKLYRSLLSLGEYLRSPRTEEYAMARFMLLAGQQPFEALVLASDRRDVGFAQEAIRLMGIARMTWGDILPGLDRLCPEYQLELLRHSMPGKREGTLTLPAAKDEYGDVVLDTEWMLEPSWHFFDRQDVW